MTSSRFVWALLPMFLVACGDGTDPIDDNTAPVAAISADATGERGVSVELDGSGSSDPDSDALTYSWTISSRPAGSSATISGANQASASFVPDAIGTWVVQLSVSDGDENDIATHSITIDVQTLGSISSDSVLANTNSPAGEADYRIDEFGLASFSADVTIEPGVTIRMGEGSGIDVTTGGSLNAVGTAALPIRFIGGQTVAGFWNNIEIGSTNSLNELSFVEIAHGGGNNYAALYVDGRLTLNNSTIRDSGDDGFWAGPGATLPGFDSNTFRDNALAAVHIPAQLLGSIDGASDYFGSGDGIVRVYSSDVTGTQTWQALDAPIHLESFGMITVSGAVTVEPGSRFVMGEGSGIHVPAGGSLAVVGTPTDTIRFVGENDVEGHWNNIEFDSNNNANRLGYVEVAHGGGNAYGAVYVDGTVQIDHTLIRNSGDLGLEASSSALLPGFASNRFTGNAEAPVSIPADLMGSMDAATVYADGNGANHILVYTDATGTAQTWKKTDAPFFLDTFDMVTINSAITVDPGFTMLMGEGSGVHIPAGGSITAHGTAADSISFVGAQATPGYWYNFEVDSNAANTMSYIRFGYGGGNNYGMVYIDGTLYLSDSHVFGSGDMGVEVSSSGTYVATNVTYSGNAGVSAD